MDYLQMTAKISFFIHHFSVCSTFMCGLDQFSDSSIFAHIRSEGIQSIMDYHHIKFTGKISFFIYFFSLFAKPSCVDWIHFQNHQFLHASGMKAFKAPWITSKSQPKSAFHSKFQLISSTFLCGLDQFSDASIFERIRHEGFQSIMDYLQMTAKIIFSSTVSGQMLNLLVWIASIFSTKLIWGT